jgi:arylsulfatase A-like enzyme
MNFPRFWLLAIVLILGTGSCPGADRPNVVVILVDDMGIMDSSVPFLAGADGAPHRYPLNEFFRTPNMERLAAQGIRFNQFCAMSVCSPTRTSIMTGQNGARHRTTNWISPTANNRGPQGPPAWNWKGLEKTSVALPRLLQSAGYRTIHVGKGHFGPNGSEGSDPKNIGFDVNVGGSAAGQPGSYYGMKQFGNVPDSAKNFLPGLEKYYGTETFLTEALTIEAKANVTQAVKDGKPFFLYFAQYAVHAPFNADPRFAANYLNSGKSAQAQAFATLIEGMDRSVGEVLDHLTTLGVASDTLILFLGDNGSDAPLGPEHEVACAAPLRGKKGTHYEGGMRVPFIAAWGKPDSSNQHQQRLPIAAGAVQTQQAAVYDIYPTILGAAGVKDPEGHLVDGRALGSLLGGKLDTARPQEFLMHYPHSHRSSYFTSYREGDWKVVYHYLPSKQSNGERYQLFHLSEDPFEARDVAKTEIAQLRKMMRQLTEKLESSGALYPVDAAGKELKPQIP